MRIAEIMTADVQTVPDTMRASEAWDVMRRRRIRHLVVVTSGGNVVGVISDRDADGPAGALLRANSLVSDVMSDDVITIEPNQPVRKAANLMRSHSISCLPVMKGRQLVGIVTIADLLELIGRGVDRPAKPARPLLHHRVAHRKQRAAGHAW